VTTQTTAKSARTAPNLTRIHDPERRLIPAFPRKPELPTRRPDVTITTNAGALRQATVIALVGVEAAPGAEIA
jgi:hypothetical protein